MISNILKRYLRKELCICIKIRVRFLQADSEDFYAIVSNSVESGWGQIDDRRDSCVGRGFILVGTDMNMMRDGKRATNHEQQSMLVGVVPFAKQVQRGRGCVRSIIGLYRLDDFLCGVRNAVYQSSRTGLFEFFARGADGELMSPRWSAALFFNESANQMVQAGSKLVEDFPDQDREPIRDSKFAKSYKDVVSSLILELADNAIWVGVGENKFADFTVEILDAFFGPLNLGSNSI